MDHPFLFPVDRPPPERFQNDKDKPSSVQGRNRKQIHDAKVCAQKDTHIGEIDKHHHQPVFAALPDSGIDHRNNPHRACYIIRLYLAFHNHPKALERQIDPVPQFIRAVFGCHKYGFRFFIDSAADSHHIASVFSGIYRLNHRLMKFIAESVFQVQCLSLVEAGISQYVPVYLNVLAVDLCNHVARLNSCLSRRIALHDAVNFRRIVAHIADYKECTDKCQNKVENRSGRNNKKSRPHRCLIKCHSGCSRRQFYPRVASCLLRFLMGSGFCIFKLILPVSCFTGNIFSGPLIPVIVG